MENSTYKLKRSRMLIEEFTKHVNKSMCKCPKGDMGPTVSVVSLDHGFLSWVHVFEENQEVVKYKFWVYPDKRFEWLSVIETPDKDMIEIELLLKRTVVPPYTGFNVVEFGELPQEFILFLKNHFHDECCGKHCGH